MRLNSIKFCCNPLMFKKWQGSRYAVFNSLNKYIKIGMLSLVYFTFIGYTKTFAQTDTSSVNKKINIQEIEVSARRTPALYSEIGRVVTVITKKEIEALPVQSVDQLLEYVAQVDVRQRGPLGVQSDVSVRGGSFDQVMILLNGINITDPQTGHLSLNLPVDFQSIERVEILEGPGARIYGASAFSGAINFITGAEKTSGVKANLLGGDHGLYNVGANGTIATKQFKNFIAANKMSCDGYIDNTDFDIYNLFYHGQLNIDNELVELQVGYTDKGFGSNSFYSARYPNQYEHTKTKFASLSFTSKSKNPIKSSVYWRRNHDRFELFRNSENAASWYSGHNYHLTDVFGANVNKVIVSKLGKTALGGDFRSESIWSSSLGNDMGEVISAPGEKDGYFSKKYSRSTTSLFLEHSYMYHNLSISAGLMAYFNSDLDWKFDVFPGVDIGYWFNNNIKVYGSVNKSLRMPTYTDLFYNSTTIQGNPDLKPEESLTYEGGVKYRTENGISANVSAFVRDGKNMIDWGKSIDASDDVPWTTSNINNIKTYGVEANMNLNFIKIFPLQTLLRSLQLDYSWLNQDKSLPAGYNSRYVFDYLKHKFSGTLSHGIISDLSASWTLQYQNRVGSYSEYDIDTELQETKDYDPFEVVDLKILWTKPNYKIYAEATNLFDVRYTDIGQLYQPGRWVKVGMQIKIGYK